MLAVAGSGKTFRLCNSIDAQKKNLLLAYTHENIRNINKELIKKFGRIPDLTSVMTFDSFIYRFVICPFEPTILSFFKEENYISKGITLKESPKQYLKLEKRPNPFYRKKEFFAHYHDANNFYYCDTMSELITYVHNKEYDILKKAAASINYLFDFVGIDEFQDYREFDYELIIKLAKQIDNFILVGDFYQHSVSAKNNTGKPFKIKKGETKYNEFKEMLKKAGFNVDETTLSYSRRCAPAICNFVSEKLNIKMVANNENSGKVIYVKTSDVSKILDNKSIVKLIIKDSKKYSFNPISWSYSKGDTYDDVCVILTDKLDDIDDFKFNIESLSTITRNKFYVACTRPRNNLYLIKSKDFKLFENNYIDK